MELEAIVYRIRINDHLFFTIEKRKSGWVIFDTGEVLGKDKSWYFESMPSHRTEEFKALTSFGSPEEALQFLKDFLDGSKAS